MRLDPNPLFRRTITPWYDGTAVCLVLLAAMLIVIGFCAIGIAVARGTPAYQAHAWLPWLILIMALLVFLSVTMRIVRRRHTECYDNGRMDDID